MTYLLHLNLIHFLDFYFSILFFFGTYRRLHQYQSIGRLIVSGPKRWPELVQLIKEHRLLFFTWGTLLPAMLALVLMLVQLVASRFIWPDAGRPPSGMTLENLLATWPALLVVLPLGAVMFAFEGYTLFLVSVIDREQIEKQLDQAEYWLCSRTAHVVRVVTFGYVNPRKMVVEEVQKALVTVSDMLNYTLWWTVTQTGLRFAFGLSLWLTWALTRG